MLAASRMGLDSGNRVYASFAVPKNDSGVFLGSSGTKPGRTVLRYCAYHVPQFMKKGNCLGSERAALVRAYVNEPLVPSLNGHAGRPVQSVNVAAVAEESTVGINCDCCAGPRTLHHSGDVRSIFDPIAAVNLCSDDLLWTILLDLIVQRQERRNDLRVEETEPGGTCILLLKNG